MHKAGDKLRVFREGLGLTQVELSKLAKISQANLSSMENCRRPIGLHTAKKLGEALGIDFTVFLR